MNSPIVSSPPAQPVSTWKPMLLDRLTCAAAAVVAMAGYLATMPPGVTGEDSGELIAAAWVMGIPHPPGYPLWTLLAYPFLHLFDIGSVAWRGHLVSVLFGAAGVWLVAETVIAVFGRRWAAFVAGVALAFSREYWQQAIIAEVYTLGAALVAAHLLCVARWTQSRNLGTLYGAGLFAGLAGAHYSLNLVLAPMLLLLFVALDLSPRRWRRYGWLVVCCLAGGLMYVYLPIRSLANPAMDWGNPQTWTGFWDVVLRRQYADLVGLGGETWTVEYLNRSFNKLGIQIFYEFTPILVVFVSYRVYSWIKTSILTKLNKQHNVSFVSPNLPFALYVLGAFLLLSAGVVLTPKFPPEYQWEWLRSAYVLPISVTVALFLGAFLYSRSDGWPWLYGLIGVIALALPLGMNTGVNNRHGDRIAEIYAFDLLTGMEPEAVYFGGGDHTIFPAVYLSIVEGVRTDVLLADRYGYPVPELYALLGEPAPAVRPSEADEQRLFEAVLARTSHPVYSAVPRDAPGYMRANEGLLYRYLRPEEALRAVKPVDVPEEAFDTRGEWSNELIVYEYLAARGRGLFDAGDPVGALAALSQAADYVHGDKHALNNLGMNAAEGGQVEAASVYFRNALDGDPLFLPAALNLAKCYLIQGTPDQALAICARLESAGVSDASLEQMKRAAQAVQKDANAAR